MEHSTSLYKTPAHLYAHLSSMAFPILTARLSESTSLSSYTRHLAFEVEGIPRFGFVPGQWLSLTHTKPDGEEITRAYSIASPPDGNRFALCLNRVQDGFMSNYLCDLEPGADVGRVLHVGASECRPRQVA